MSFQFFRVLKISFSLKATNNRKPLSVNFLGTRRFIQSITPRNITEDTRHHFGHLVF